MASLLRRTYLLYLSKPVADRAVLQAVAQLRPRRIVEIGVGDAVRASRMLELACGVRPGEEIWYTGMDLFEANRGLPLKAAYRTLRQSGAKVRLVPGDPCQALRQAANELPNVELLVLAPSVTAEQMAAAWYFVPRMLAPRATVLWLDGKTPVAKPRIVSLAEIARLANPAAPGRRRAA